MEDSCQLGRNPGLCLVLPRPLGCSEGRLPPAIVIPLLCLRGLLPPGDEASDEILRFLSLPSSADCRAIWRRASLPPPSQQSSDGRRQGCGLVGVMGTSTETLLNTAGTAASSHIIDESYFFPRYDEEPVAIKMLTVICHSKNGGIKGSGCVMTLNESQKHPGGTSIPMYSI